MEADARFPLLGEPLSLDLVNTRVRRNGFDVDLLDSPVALKSWVRAEASRIAWSGTIDDDDWHAMRVLRDALADLFQAYRTHTQPREASIEQVNAALAQPGACMRLEWTGMQPRVAALPKAARRHAMLAALATDAVHLLTGPDAARLRQCANPDCILTFVARNPRRRWCSSALCGNRVRVARHYVRHHGRE